MKRNAKQGHTSKSDNDWMYKNINPYYDKIRNEETMKLVDTVKQVLTGNSKVEVEEQKTKVNEFLPAIAAVAALSGNGKKKASKVKKEDTDKETPGTQGDNKEWQAKRAKVLKKFGVGSCAALKDDKEKKACFKALDDAHVADHEEQVELIHIKKEETQKSAHSKLFDLIKSTIQGK